MSKAHRYSVAILQNTFIPTQFPGNVAIEFTSTLSTTPELEDAGVAEIQKMFPESTCRRSKGATFVTINGQENQVAVFQQD